MGSCSSPPKAAVNGVACCWKRCAAD